MGNVLAQKAASTQPSIDRKEQAGGRDESARTVRRQSADVRGGAARAGRGPPDLPALAGGTRRTGAWSRRPTGRRVRAGRIVERTCRWTRRGTVSGQGLPRVEHVSRVVPTNGVRREPEMKEGGDLS